MPYIARLFWINRHISDCVFSGAALGRSEVPIINEVVSWCGLREIERQQTDAFLAGSARLIVWVIVNVENWDPTGSMPRAVLLPPMGSPLIPDLPNWARHEHRMAGGSLARP